MPSALPPTMLTPEELEALVEGLRHALPDLILIGVQDVEAGMPAVPPGWTDYEALLAGGDPGAVSHRVLVCP